MASVSVNLDRLRKYLDSLVPLCVMLAFAASLLKISVARDLFFSGFYLAALGLITTFTHPASHQSASADWRPLCLCLFALGLLKIGWAFYFYPAQHHNESYLRAMDIGKRLLAAAGMLWYLGRRAWLPTPGWRRATEGIILFGFLAATAYGLIQHHQGLERVEFSFNRATGAAYVYSVLALAALTVVIRRHFFARTLTVIVLFCLAYATLILTGTRASILLFPVLFLGIFLTLAWREHLRLLAGIAVGLVAIVAILYQPVLKTRIASTQQEIAVFENSDGNSDSSLGARFAMWRSGVDFLRTNHWGASVEQRAEVIERNIELSHHDSAAKLYLQVHLHNELIDALTLEGIPGGVLLVLFWLVGLVQALRTRNALLFVSIAGLLGYGLTDCPMLSKEITIAYLSLVVISLFCLPPASLNAPVRQAESTA